MRWRSKGAAPAVKCSPGLARLFRARLELLLERSELGERRIRIGRPVAAVPALAAPLDVFRAQVRIALRSIATRSTVGTVAALRTIAAIGTIGAPRTVGTIRALPALITLISIGTTMAPVAATTLATPLAFVGCRRWFDHGGRRRARTIGADRRRGIGGGSRERRSLRVPLWPALARSAFVAGLARMIVEAPGPPDLDHFLGCGLRCRGDRRWLRRR